MSLVTSDALITSNSCSMWLRSRGNTIFTDYFEFRKEPKLFDLPGIITSHCMLDPVSYLARFCDKGFERQKVLWRVSHNNER